MNLLRPYGDWDTTLLSEGFRRKIPVDARYVSISRQPQPTVTALASYDKTCTFRFLPISDIYLFHDCKISMELKLVTKGEPRTKPVAGSYIGPVNNVLSSCISEVKIWVNGVPGMCTFILFVIRRTSRL
jgi:hypothetical protein